MSDLQKYKVIKTSIHGTKGAVIMLHLRQATFLVTSGFIELQAAIKPKQDGDKK